MSPQRLHKLAYSLACFLRLKIFATAHIVTSYKQTYPHLLRDLHTNIHLSICILTSLLLISTITALNTYILEYILNLLGCILIFILSDSLFTYVISYTSSLLQLSQLTLCPFYFSLTYVFLFSPHKALLLLLYP